MLQVICDNCEKELDELGALLFSPPDKEGFCQKIHLCKKCYEGLRVDNENSDN